MLLKRLRVLFLVLGVSLFSCQKDSSNDFTPGSTYGDQVKTTIAGIVVDDNNFPVIGATIIINNKKYFSGHGGTFFIKDVYVNKNRFFISISHAVYMTMYKSAIPNTGSVTYMQIMLYPYNVNFSFSASQGKVYSGTNGVGIVLPANGYVTASGNAYSGIVRARARFLNPADSNFASMIPGSDLMAINSSDESRILYSYGMLEVSLFANQTTERLYIASGYSATLTFPIDPSQQASAPVQIPTWYFDEDLALWKEEGFAVRNGNQYEFAVNHFSWWNCDVPERTAFIKGKVKDCNGSPIANAVVTINNMYTAISDNFGGYYSPVGINISFPVQVLSSNNLGVFSNSQIETVPQLSAQQVFVLPDLIVPCSAAKLIGTISGCTGQPGSGLVVATWSGGRNFIYCNNGTFALNVLESTSISLKYYTSSTSTNYQISAGPAGSTTNIGNIVLCDQTPISSGNSFVINGDGYTQQLINIDTIHTIAFEPNGHYIYINGVFLPTGQNVILDFFVPDTLPQTYLFNSTIYSSGLTLHIGNDTYNSIHMDIIPTGYLTLQQWNPRAIGHFHCTLRRQNGIEIQISNGKFDASFLY